MREYAFLFVFAAVCIIIGTLIPSYIRAPTGETLAFFNKHRTIGIENPKCRWSDYVGYPIECQSDTEATFWLSESLIAAVIEVQIIRERWLKEQEIREYSPKENQDGNK